MRSVARTGREPATYDRLMTGVETGPPTGAPVYRERLRVPVRWWVLGTLLIATFSVAMVVALPGWLTVTLTGFLLLLMGGLLATYGAARIGVTDTWLHVGRARIERSHLGDVVALDAQRMRALAGPEANVRAYLLLRPYVSTGIRIDIDDPRDPTPYWLVSSRRPEALAAALASEVHRAEQSPGSTRLGS